MQAFVQKWKSWLVAAGVVVVAVVLAVVVIAVSPPGCLQTDPEPKHPDGPPNPPISSLDRLRSPWDSEGEAIWPVTELATFQTYSVRMTPRVGGRPSTKSTATMECSTILPAGRTVAATRSIASRARSGQRTLTFGISQVPNLRNWAMAGGSSG